MISNYYDPQESDEVQKIHIGNILSYTHNSNSPKNSNEPKVDRPRLVFGRSNAFDLLI